MKGRRATSSQVRGLKWRVVLLAGAVALCACGAASAQNGAPYTLHVNVRLMQVPTLVLSTSLQPLPRIDRKKFKIRLDSGRSFRPSEARLEGDDPITLAILLDLSGSESDLISELGRDLAPWIAGSFRPADRIAIYGLDCVLVRTKGYMVANPELLQSAFNTILHSPVVHGTKLASSCGNSLRLWDALGVVSRQVSAQPGRGVILAVTYGDDRRSVTKISDVRAIAAGQSVTIFGLSQRVSFFNRGRVEENLSPLCQFSGGLLFLTPGSLLPEELRTFVDMVRGRYILEFPEPANATPGAHSIDVTIDHTRAFIRPAGVTAVLDDPNKAHDSTLLPSDTSKAPRVGKAHAHDP